MSDPDVVQAINSAIPEIPVAILVGVVEANTPPTPDSPPIRRGRSRTRGREGLHLQQQHSLSPTEIPREPEAPRAIPPSEVNFTVGATLSRWNQIIEGAERNPEREDVATTIRSLMHYFSIVTRLEAEADLAQSFANLDIQDDEDDEDDGKYIEAVYVKKTNTHHNLYTGSQGGKFFYDHNGQQKYIRGTKLKPVLVDPEVTPVVDTNPSLRNTDVILRDV